MRYRKLWVRVALLPIFFWANAAYCQDFWEISEGAKTWEDSWDQGLWTEPGRWPLSLTFGRRTFETRKELNEHAASSTPGRARRGSELYATATLQLPIDALFGRRRRQASSSNVEGGEIERSRRGEYLAQNSSEEEDEVGGASGSSGTPNLSLAAERKIESTEVDRYSSGPEIESELEGNGPKQGSRRETSSAPRGTDNFNFLRAIDELLRRVRLASGSLGDRARLRALAKRARLSGLAPELRLRGVYGLDQSTSLDDAGGILPGESSTRGGRDSLGEVRLTFHLERLLFSSQESGFEKQRVQSRDSQRKRESEAIDLFLSWKTADMQAHDPTRFPEEQELATAKALAALAHLRLLTGGWFEGWRSFRDLETIGSERKNAKE